MITPHPRLRQHWLTSLTALLALLGAFVSCASPTVVRKSESPQTKDVPGRGNYHWESKSGWVRPSRGTWGPPAQIRAESRKALDAGAYAEALSGYMEYKKTLAQDDASATETNFLIAECYYHLGNYDEAVEFYREVYKKQRPDLDILNKTFQRMNDIAMDYLHEKAACSFIGFKYSCPSHGIELLVGDDGLITEYPNLSFADDAIFEIAKYYFDTKQYAEAVPVYERIVREYPQSEWRGPAKYHVALATYRQVRGVDYDEKLIEDSDRKFREYLETDPRGPQSEDAREKLREITEKLGEKNLGIAKFYLRESEPSAAEIYLKIVTDRYTTSSAARAAREIQSQLRKTTR